MDSSSSPHQGLPACFALDLLSEQDRACVKQTAADLERAAQEGGAPQQRLRNKQLVVLCEPADCPNLTLVRNAAAALGVRVTRIRPSDLFDGLRGTLDDVGAMLGKLYDGIDCHGLAPEVVEQLARTAGKPVFQSNGCGGSCEPMTSFTAQALLLTLLS